MSNPLIAQGLLNRVITHVIVPSFPQLTTFASYMSKAMATLTFEPPFVIQFQTATGIVNSPEPFVMGQVVINLLRTQALASLWLAQTQVNCNIGTVTTYSDSTNFSAITLANCSITDFEPGPYDGMDPTVKATVKGVYYVNPLLWAAASGSSTLSGL